MHKHLFAHIDIDPKNVHILDGNAANLEAECDKYEEEIQKVGGIELFLGGSHLLTDHNPDFEGLVQTDTLRSMNLEVVSPLALGSRPSYLTLPRTTMTGRHMTPSLQTHDSSTMTSHLFQKWLLRWGWEQSWTQEK